MNISGGSEVHGHGILVEIIGAVHAVELDHAVDELDWHSPMHAKIILGLPRNIFLRNIVTEEIYTSAVEKLFNSIITI